MLPLFNLSKKTMKARPNKEKQTVELDFDGTAKTFKVDTKLCTECFLRQPVERFSSPDSEVCLDCE